MSSSEKRSANRDSCRPRLSARKLARNLPLLPCCRTPLKPVALSNLGPVPGDELDGVEVEAHPVDQREVEDVDFDREERAELDLAGIEAARVERLVARERGGGVRREFGTRSSWSMKIGRSSGCSRRYSRVPQCQPSCWPSPRSSPSFSPAACPLSMKKEPRGSPPWMLRLKEAKLSTLDGAVRWRSSPCRRSCRRKPSRSR